jgi:hypothetical protein
LDYKGAALPYHNNTIDTIEISVKSGKDSTRTLSLVIHRVRFKTRFKTKPAKMYISIQQGVKETQKTVNFDGFLSFTLSFFFPDHLHCCYIDFHCSYLYSYYNCSRSLCIKCWDSAFRTEFQHFILRFNKISFALLIPLKRRVSG